MRTSSVLNKTFLRESLAVGNERAHRKDRLAKTVLHKQPVHVWLLPRYYTNPVDSVPSPRHGFELHLPPLLAQKCIRASSPGCRHTTICKTCLREDKAPAHTTAAYVVMQDGRIHEEYLDRAARRTNTQRGKRDKEEQRRHHIKYLQSDFRKTLADISVCHLAILRAVRPHYWA